MKRNILFYGEIIANPVFKNLKSLTIFLSPEPEGQK
jgi:hypothetical protein